MKTNKILCDCGHIAVSDGCGTGYGRNKDNKTICYACCAENDKKELIETGKLHGYFDGQKFTNWPGSFSIPVNYQSKSWHNFAGKNGRTDFWLYFEGQRYHGVFIGFNHQCATIKRVKQ
jgi:hypothetical protein